MPYVGIGGKGELGNHQHAATGLLYVKVRFVVIITKDAITQYTLR